MRISEALEIYVITTLGILSNSEVNNALNRTEASSLRLEPPKTSGSDVLRSSVLLDAGGGR